MIGQVEWKCHPSLQRDREGNGSSGKLHKNMDGRMMLGQKLNWHRMSKGYSHH